MKFKDVLNYRKRFKHQKNRAKRYKKRINKLQKGLTEELKLDITNEEIKNLKLEIFRLKKHIIKLNNECNSYFNLLMEKENER